MLLLLLLGWGVCGVGGSRKAVAIAAACNRRRGRRASLQCVCVPMAGVVRGGACLPVASMLVVRAGLLDIISCRVVGYLIDWIECG
jgi:hypothetical protein